MQVISRSRSSGHAHATAANDQHLSDRLSKLSLNFKTYLVRSKSVSCGHAVAIAATPLSVMRLQPDRFSVSSWRQLEAAASRVASLTLRFQYSDSERSCGLLFSSGTMPASVTL